MADDHPLFRESLRSMLEKESDFQVIGEASNGEDVIRLADELKPDVIIMDFAMPKLNGLEATRQIKAKYPSIIILVLTVYDDIEHILGLLEAGAAGYLTKTVFGNEVVNAVRSVASGETVLSPTILHEVLKRVSQRMYRPLPSYQGEQPTKRELEILQIAARGLSNRDIADCLNIGVPTIKSYLANIFTKLHVGSRTEAVVYCIKNGIITLEDLE